MHKESRGFILAELMVAVLLLGLVLTPMISLFLAGSQISADSWFETTALNLAQSKLEDVKDLPYDSVVEQSGIFFDKPEYAYEVSVSPDPEYPGLIKLATVTVYYSGRAETKNVKLTMAKLKR